MRKSVHRFVVNAGIARKRRNFIACLICPYIIMFYSAILRAILPHRHTEVSSKVPNPINRHQLICPRSVVSAMLWSSIPKQEKQAVTRLELEASIVIIDFFGRINLIITSGTKKCHCGIFFEMSATERIFICALTIDASQ